MSSDASPGASASKLAAREPPQVSLRLALQRFLRDLPEARAVSVGDPNGLPIASLGRGPARSAPALETTAMATMALGAAEQIVASLRLGLSLEVNVRTATAVVIIRDLGRGFSLSVVLAGEANLGLATLTIGRLADEVRAILARLA